MNSSATGTSGLPISDLPRVTLTGKAAGGTDTVLFDTLGGDISAVAADSVLNLEQNVWFDAEFNVFGNGDGDEVNLNSYASLVVQVSLDNGTTDTPTYSTQSNTGETNNLTLTQTAPCMYGGTTPMIQFLESDDSDTSASCGGTGIELTPSTATVSPSDLVFPTCTSLETVTFTNKGEGPLALGSWAFDGTFEAKATTCVAGEQLQPNQSCTMTVWPEGKYSNDGNGTLTFVDTALSSPQTVPLLVNSCR